MWNHGPMTVGGKDVVSSVKMKGGKVVAVDLYPPVDPAAAIVIGNETYYVSYANGKPEEHGDRVTMPVASKADMEAIADGLAKQAAQAKADFEGKPPLDRADIVNVPSPAEVPIGKSGKG